MSDDLSLLYQEHIIDHSQNPRHFGTLEGKKLSTQMSNLSCGDGITVEVKINEAGVIEDVGWQGTGCAISMAAASIISEWAIGQKLTDVQALTIEDILPRLGLPTISHSRIKCAYLFVHALQKLQTLEVSAT
jgi:nitrogen fixation NifU-like protein